jgi:hypothetical protein
MSKWGFVFAAVAGAGLALTLTPADAAKSVAKDGEADKAAAAFLASLPADLRKKVAYATDASARREFHFVPRERIGA